MEVTSTLTASQKGVREADLFDGEDAAAEEELGRAGSDNAVAEVVLRGKVVAWRFREFSGLMPQPVTTVAPVTLDAPCTVGMTLPTGKGEVIAVVDDPADARVVRPVVMTPWPELVPEHTPAPVVMVVAPCCQDVTERLLLLLLQLLQVLLLLLPTPTQKQPPVFGGVAQESVSPAAVGASEDSGLAGRGVLLVLLLEACGWSRRPCH